MALPSRPPAHCIRIEPHLPFGLCQTPRNRPAASSHLDHRLPGGPRRRTHEIGRALCRVAQPAADHEPPAPGSVRRRREREPPPIIPPGPFGPVTSPPPAPVLLLQPRQERFDWPLAASPPDICLPRDGDARRLGPLFSARPERSSLPVHALPSHPSRRPRRVARAFQPLSGTLWLGRTDAFRRNPCARAPRHVVPPRLRQRQGPIPEDMALRTRLG